MTADATPAATWYTDEIERLHRENVRLRADLSYVRTYVRVVLTSPVCHPHNAITLREIVAEINERLGDDSS